MADPANTPPTNAAEPINAVADDAKSGRRSSMAADVTEAIEDLRKLGPWLRSVRAETWIVLLLVVGLVFGWEWIAAQFPSAIIPSMGETTDAFFRMLNDDRRNYFNAVVNSIQNYYAGLALAILIGWGLAGLMGLSPLFGRVMKVVLDFLGNIPLIAFMPLFVALLGLGMTAKIVIILLAAAIVITTTAHSAFESVDRGAEEAARVLGANRLQAQVLVVWPQVLPQMIAGLRLGAAQALTACIIAEIYTAMTGLGGLIVGYGASFNMPRYFVAVLTTLAIGSATAAVLRHLERCFAVP